MRSALTADRFRRGQALKVVSFRMTRNLAANLSCLSCLHALSLTTPSGFSWHRGQEEPHPLRCGHRFGNGLLSHLRHAFHDEDNSQPPILITVKESRQFLINTGVQHWVLRRHLREGSVQACQALGNNTCCDAMFGSAAIVLSWLADEHSSQLCQWEVSRSLFLKSIHNV